MTFITAAESLLYMREEQRKSRAAARAFERVCISGDRDMFLSACQLLDEVYDGWRLAMRRVARLPSVPRAIQYAWVDEWTMRKMIALTIANQPLAARAFRVLFPKPRPRKRPKRLYRGTMADERQPRYVQGFSWTPDRAVAESFAQDYRAARLGSVVLQTDAPPEAVLYVSNNRPYNESEFIVDPYRLGRVHVVARMSTTRPIDFDANVERVLRGYTQTADTDAYAG